MQTLASHCRGAARWRIGALFLALVFCASSALAQFTVVTGTVTDPNGVPYALGTIAPLLITSATPTFTASGQLYFPPSQASGLDGTGHFLVRIADNTFLSPGGTTWNFTVCSAIGTVQPAFGTGPQCFNLAAPITISGATQDITTQLHARALALTLPFSAGGGTVTGSGTAGTMPVWTGTTALGNSLITSCAGAQTCATGSTTGKVQIGTVLNPLTAAVGSSTLSNANPSACGGANAIPLPTFGCIGGQVAFFNNAGTTADVSAGFQVVSHPSNFVAGTLGFGVSSQVQAGFNETETRAGYFEAYENVSTTVTTRRGLFAFAANGTGNTTATNEGLVVQTGAQSGTNTSDISLHILSPNLNIGGSGGTLGSHVSLQIDDATVTGVGSNPSPVAIQTLGVAPSKFGGLVVPPVSALASLPGCGASTEGGHAVATNCTAGCTVSGTCTAGGTFHCELYCSGGGGYVETGR